MPGLLFVAKKGQLARRLARLAEMVGEPFVMFPRNRAVRAGEPAAALVVPDANELFDSTFRLGPGTLRFNGLRITRNEKDPTDTTAAEQQGDQRHDQHDRQPFAELSIVVWSRVRHAILLLKSYRRGRPVIRRQIGVNATGLGRFKRRVAGLWEYTVNSASWRFRVK